MGRVHLTFDNGPHPEGTPRVLHALAQRDVEATFFVLGKHLATPSGRDLACSVRDAGHALANHSWSHETPLGQDPRPDAVHLQLQKTQDLLDAIAPGPVWFRPFGGGGILGPHLLSPAAVAWLEERDATCALWNSVPGDWRDPHGWVDVALADADRQEHTVVVLHDFVLDAIDHLDRFLALLVDRGHTFTTEWPDDCLPIRAGQTRRELSNYVQNPGADR